VRSLAVLILAAATFAGFIIRGHFRAAALRTSEANALDQTLRLAEKPGRVPSVSGGYRFFWERSDDLPDLLVAVPVERGQGGLRWFATPDGVAVYEYDTALFIATGQELAALRRYLARNAEQRRKTTVPIGWRLLE